MYFGVLGPLEVRRQREGAEAIDIGTPKDRAVLTVLLADAGRAVPAESLVDAVWGEKATLNAVGNLQVNVHRLRRALGGPGVIEYVDGGYRVVIGDGELDVGRAEELAERARTAAPEGASELLNRALELWRGEPFADCAGAPLLQPVAARLAELRMTLLERRIDADLNCGRHSGLVAELTELTLAHPLRERFHARLMLALQRCGRQAEALRAYQSARLTLREEVGAEPGAELRRLRARILDGDGLVPSTPAVPAQLPSPVGLFVGRAEVVRRLDGALAKGRRAVAVVGSGGVGKTALVVQWAHRNRDRFRDGQLWVDLRGYASAAPLRAEDVVTRFLRSLGFSGEQLPPDPDEQFALLRTVLADRRVLVVLDNAHSAEQVRPLLTGAAGCLTLITSRNRLRGLAAREEVQPIEVAALSRQEARGLLAGLLPSPVEPDVLDELARRCAYLPLALRIAAANLAQGEAGEIAGYLAGLTDRDLLDDLSPQDDAVAAVRSAFESSYRALAQPQRRLFRRLGLVPGKDITAEAAATLIEGTESGTRRLLDQLATVHLVERRAEERFQLHDLLRIYAAERAHEEERPGERESARSRLFDHYLHTAYHATLPISIVRSATAAAPAPRMGRDASEAMRWLETELPNLLAIVSEQPAPHAWQITTALEFYFRATCAYGTWQSTGTIALETARRSGGDVDIANLHVSMGHACMESGDFTRALLHGRAARDHATAAEWQEGRCWGLAVMGWAYGCMGEFRLSTEVLQTAVRIAGTHALADARIVAVLHLGDALLCGGRLQQARAHYEDVLQSTADGGGQLFRGLAFLGLGTVRWRAGDPERAVRGLEAAAELLVSGYPRSGHAEALAMLALAHHDAGRGPLAQQIGREAVRLARERHETGKIPVALRSLAATYEQTDPPHAIDLYTQALTAARDAARPQQEIEAMCGRARAMIDAGRPECALAEAERARDLGREDEWPIQTAIVHTTLAQAHLALGAPADAAEHATRAIEIAELSGAGLWRSRALRVLGAVQAGHGGRESQGRQQPCS